MENKWVVTSKENEGVGGEERVIMWLYGIICVKILKIVKHYRI